MTTTTKEATGRRSRREGPAPVITGTAAVGFDPAGGEGAHIPAGTGPTPPVNGTTPGVTPATPGAAGEYFARIPLKHIVPSTTNPRRHVDVKKQAELTASVRRLGVLQPILVRPMGPPDLFEIVGGFCRWTAACDAGQLEIPAIVRELTDIEALEIQLVENIQRSDLHPLEEAQGYQALASRGYEVARIAERVGRSTAYVYDRMKLMQLGERAKQLFLEDVLTAGHAILLARLSEKDQKRALDDTAVICAEALLPLVDTPGGLQRHQKESLRPCSVRELQAWIDEHVRFDAGAVDPMLFPETALDINLARERKGKVVAITFSHYIPLEARDGKTFGPRSWKRADGEHKSKKCDCSVTGFVAVGPRRGESFEVCVNKQRCEVHWPEQVRARKRAAAASPKAGTKSDAKPETQREDSWTRRNREEQERRAKAERGYNAIRTKLVAAAAERVSKAPVSGKSALGQLLIRAVRRYGGGASNTIPLGSTAESLVRHAVWQYVAQASSGYDAHNAFPRLCVEIGVDVAKIRKETKAAEPKPAKKAAKKKRGGR